MEISFLELRNKEVINVLDGRSLGHIVDAIIDIRTSRTLGFVVPGDSSFFNFLKPCPEIFIPYKNICKIGEDVMLVEVTGLTNNKNKTRKIRLFNKFTDNGNNQNTTTETGYPQQNDANTMQKTYAELADEGDDNFIN